MSRIKSRTGAELVAPESRADLGQMIQRVRAPEPYPRVMKRQVIEIKLF